MRCTVGPAGQREDGVVLILVLVMLVVTIAMAAGFMRIVSLETAGRMARTNRVRVELLAESGIEIGKRALSDDLARDETDPLALVESSQDSWAILSQQKIEAEDGSELVVKVVDAGNRINLNGLVDADGQALPESREFLKLALEVIIENMPGRREEKRYDPDELADALIDWVDSDETTRLGDDEESFYQGKGADHGPAGRNLVSVSELALIPGVDGALLRALEKYFTTFPIYPENDPIGINPNTAPPYMLALLYQGTSDDMNLVEDDDIFAILRTRDDDRVFCPEAIEDPCVEYESEIGRVGELVFPPLSYESQVFEVRSEARHKGSRACITAVIDRSNQQEMTTLSYRLGC